MLVVGALVGTSAFWLPTEEEDDPEPSPTPTPENTEGEESEADEESVNPIISAADLTPTLDPAIEQILESLELESLGVGDEPFVVRAGNFTVIDNLHRGLGTANVYRVTDDQFALRFESFEVSNGPDLTVVLSRNSEPRTSADTLLPSHIELGPLKAPEGEQTYAIPEDTNLTLYKSVVIYSTSLNLVYTTAELELVRGAGQ